MSEQERVSLGNVTVNIVCRMLGTPVYVVTEQAQADPIKGEAVENHQFRNVFKAEFILYND